MRKYLIFLLAAVFLVVGSMAATVGFAGIIGKPVPDVKIQTIDGKEVVIRDYVGTPENPKEREGTLIVFYNSSCRVCRTELKYLTKYQDNKDIEILGINIDMRTAAGVPKIKEQLGIKFNILWDPEFVLGRGMGIYLTPGSAFVDNKGVIQALNKGFDPEIQKKIDSYFQQ